MDLFQKKTPHLNAFAGVLINRNMKSEAFVTARTLSFAYKMLIDSTVVFQGDIVNNIEQNVSKSVDHIMVAKEQTKKAVRYQTKARKVM